MPVKVLDESGMGFFSDILDGVDWARTHGADIINLSLGGILEPAQVALIQPTFTAARAAGILVVAASGNSGSPIMEYPAGLRGVVSVAAVDATDLQADFSTFNRGVDIAAPGVDILSTTAGDYEEESGTSMASPHVAGVAALIWSARPALERHRARSGPPRERRGPRRPRPRQRLRLRPRRCRGGPVRGGPEPVARSRAGARLHRSADDHVLPAGRPEKQTTRTVDVAFTTSHAVIDGIVVRLSWRLENGRCPDPELVFYDDSVLLDFISPIHETGLRAGFCYRWDALAIDEEAQLAETISPRVSIVDRTSPRIKSRSPQVGRDGRLTPPRSRSSSPSRSGASRARRSG